MSVKLRIRYAVGDDNAMQTISETGVCFAAVADIGRRKMPKRNLNFIQLGAAMSGKMADKKAFKKYLLRTVFGKGYKSIEWEGTTRRGAIAFYTHPNMPTPLACAYLSPVRMMTESPMNGQAFLKLCEEGVNPTVALMLAQFYGYSRHTWMRCSLGGHSVVPASFLCYGDIKNIRKFPSKRLVNQLPPCGFEGGQDWLNHRGPGMNKVSSYSELIMSRLMNRMHHPGTGNPGEKYMSIVSRYGNPMSIQGIQLSDILKVASFMYEDGGYVFPQKLRNKMEA